MTVFIDTNVILDYVLRREHYAEAKETIVKLVAAGDKMLMSVGGFRCQGTGQWHERRMKDEGRRLM